MKEGDSQRLSRLHRLFEKRVLQLEKRGKLEINPDYKEVLDSKFSKSNTMRVIARNYSLTCFDFVGKTVEGSDDFILKRLYEAYVEEHALISDSRKRGMHEHLNNIEKSITIYSPFSCSLQL